MGDITEQQRGGGKLWAMRALEKLFEFLNSHLNARNRAPLCDDVGSCIIHLLKLAAIFFHHTTCELSDPDNAGCKRNPVHIEENRSRLSWTKPRSQESCELKTSTKVERSDGEVRRAGSCM